MQNDKNRQAVAATEELSGQGFDVGQVARTLHGAMDALLEDKKKITPEAVNAACNCAQQITNLLRVHLEAQRVALRVGGLGRTK